jgi:hypothetical protein
LPENPSDPEDDPDPTVICTTLDSLSDNKSFLCCNTSGLVSLLVGAGTGIVVMCDGPLINSFISFAGVLGGDMKFPGGNLLVNAVDMDVELLAGDAEKFPSDIRVCWPIVNPSVLFILLGGVRLPPVSSLMSMSGF